MSIIEHYTRLLQTEYLKIHKPQKISDNFSKLSDIQKYTLICALVSLSNHPLDKLKKIEQSFGKVFTALYSFTNFVIPFLPVLSVNCIKYTPGVRLPTFS